jgi:hypothetical protein
MSHQTIPSRLVIRSNFGYECRNVQDRDKGNDDYNGSDEDKSTTTETTAEAKALPSSTFIWSYLDMTTEMPSDKISTTLPNSPNIPPFPSAPHDKNKHSNQG